MTFAGAPHWSATCELLQLWRDAGIAAPHIDDGEVFDDWMVMRRGIEPILKDHPRRERLSTDEGVAVDELASAGPVGAHAAAWAIDEAYWPTFSKPWIAGRVISLVEGDVFPISDWDTDVRPLEKRLSRPWQTQMRADELPHVRRFRPLPDDPGVVFDGSYFDELAFLDGVRVVAGVVLNDGLEEFELPADGFPIRPGNTDRQSSLVQKAAELAFQGPAELVVFPELAVPQEAVDRLAAAVVGCRRNVAVVAGSFHAEVDDKRQNLSTLVTPAGDRITCAKRAPFWDAKTRESIDPVADPLRILVAGNVRLAVAVCKDSLTEPTVEVLAHCGANLIVAPSMSRVTNLHEITAQMFAMRAHALTVIANGPRTFGDEEPPQMIVCRPEADPTRRTVSRAGVQPVAVVRCDLVSGEFAVDVLDSDRELPTTW